MQRLLRIFNDKPEFTTERLILRPISDSDFDFFCLLCNNENAAQYLSNNLETLPEKIRLDFERLVDWTEQQFMYSWIITEKTTQKKIGQISIQTVSINESKLDIGYVLLSEHRRKGYMFEAISRLLDYLFNEIEVYKIGASCSADNVASGNLLKKCGFGIEDILERHKYDETTNSFKDWIVYSLDRDDYLKVNLT